MLHAAVHLSEIHKGCHRGLFLELRAVNKVAQGKKLVHDGHAGTKSGLARDPEPSILRPADNTLIEDGRIQRA